MTTDGATATAVLTVEEEGEYHIATSFNAAPVQLTDNYFIDVQADNRPVVKVVKPGRDWRASNIEEVLVRVEATDDFNLDRLELNYAINGGEWQVAALEADGDYALTEEVLFLEEMRAERTPFVSNAASNIFDIINSNELEIETLEETQEAQDEGPQVDFLHEPSPEAIFKGLLPKFIEVKIYSALMESLASELRSLTPMATVTPASRAARHSKSTSGPGMVTALRCNSTNSSRSG